MRIGMGYDVHRLVEGRDLVIGGVTIPYELGLLGHSDADVLLHAISDALLGAAALGDIGKHFPDTDSAYKGISSIILLKQVGKLIEENMFYIENIDATIIAQAPKMRPYIDQMRENIANALGISADQVNVKATTEEGLGFTGEGKGISAQAICMLTSPREMATMEAVDVSMLTSPREMASKEASDVSMPTSPREMTTMEAKESLAGVLPCENCPGCKAMKHT